MPNIWWDRNKSLSVSKSHSEDNSPKTQTASAPMKMMTATWCHRTAKTITGLVRCTYVRVSRHSLWEIFALCVPSQCAHASLICKKQKNTHILHIFQNVKLTATFFKTKMQFLLGWSCCVVQAACWSCYCQMFALGWFIQTSQHTKQIKIPVLTHIHSILYPLDNVECVLHVALQDVKFDVVTA